MPHPESAKQLPATKKEESKTVLEAGADKNAKYQIKLTAITS